MNIADWPNGMKFIQSDSQFKLTTDSVLLAHFAANSKVRKICEPCCGIGGIAILLAGHIPHAHISCLEFQEEAALLAKENAEITRRILTGEETGPKRDVILMNAGMSLYLGIDGITLAEGIEKAKEMIDSGKAYAKLQEFVKATQEA